MTTLVKPLNSELTYSVVKEFFETQNTSYENAKQHELASWKDNNAHECVQNKNQYCLLLYWVCSIKPPVTGLKPKARLVACGFEEDCPSKSEKEFPTCSKDTFGAMLGLTIQNDWELQAINIKTTLLQGEHIDREVFVIAPTESNALEEYVILNKCIYGLSNNSLKWYSELKTL